MRMVDDPVLGDVVVVSARYAPTGEGDSIPLWPYDDRHLAGEVVDRLPHGSAMVIIGVPIVQLYGSLGFTQFVVLANGHVGWVFAHQVSR